MNYRWTLPTAFEQQVQKLSLNKGTCVASEPLREWCERNKEQLKEWGIFVEVHMSISQGVESLTRGRHSHIDSRLTRPRARLS